MTDETHRSDRVFLAADVARCEPGKPCAQKTRCARYAAVVPKFGSMFGNDMPATNGFCTYFLSIEEGRHLVAAPAPRVVKPAPAGRL